MYQFIRNKVGQRVGLVRSECYEIKFRQPGQSNTKYFHFLDMANATKIPASMLIDTDWCLSILIILIDSLLTLIDVD